MIFLIWVGILILCFISYGKGHIDGTMKCINRLEKHMTDNFGPNWKE